MTTRYLTTTADAKDTRQIPGWALNSRRTPVGLVYWTPATNSICDWSVGDFEPAKIDAHLATAKALGADAWLFDLENPNGGQLTLVALHKLLDHIRTVSKIPVLLYGGPYVQEDGGLYDKCGGVRVPVGQIMRPDDLKQHIKDIASWSMSLKTAHPTLPRYYVLQDTYNWSELATAAKAQGIEEHAAARWWPDLPQADCRKILDVCDASHTGVIAFQPAMMPNPWQGGIRPLYLELLR